MTPDPFEQSLRDMLKASEQAPSGDDASLGKVLKKANRQLGAGAIFSLFGRALESVMIGLTKGSAHLQPVSRLSDNTHEHKAD